MKGMIEMKRVFASLIGVVLLTSIGTGEALARSTPRVTKKVSIVNFAFMPRTLQVTRGTTVKWTNNAPTTTHTTTSDTGLWNKRLAPGQSFSRAFNQSGTFRYHCTIHPTMTGKIVVSG
jgi:plastocyanin